jgi:hypothetical protein
MLHLMGFQRAASVLYVRKRGKTMVGLDSEGDLRVEGARQEIGGVCGNTLLLIAPECGNGLRCCSLRIMT